MAASHLLPAAAQGFGRLDLIDFHEDVRTFQSWPPAHFSQQVGSGPAVWAAAEQLGSAACGAPLKRPADAH